MVKNKNHPKLGGSLTGSSKQPIATNWLYFQVLGGRMLIAAVVSLEIGISPPTYLVWENDLSGTFF
jgi:hypothetical protein